MRKRLWLNILAGSGVFSALIYLCYGLLDLTRYSLAKLPIANITVTAARLIIVIVAEMMLTVGFL
jgi:hypothetical protein